MGKLKVKIEQLPKSMFIDCPVCKGTGKNTSTSLLDLDKRCYGCDGRGKVYGGNRKERRK